MENNRRLGSMFRGRRYRLSCQRISLEAYSAALVVFRLAMFAGEQS
jgi:hypothetical protein